MCGRARRGAVFVVRQHGQVQGELLGPAMRKGTTRSGLGLPNAACLAMLDGRTRDLPVLA
jgi:hypothetical protein